jgi:ABC-type glycerol-3-phosphate transport system permease component
MSLNKALLAILIIIIGAWFVLPAWLILQTTFVGAFSYHFPWTLEWGLANWKALPWNRLFGATVNSVIVCSFNSLLTTLVCIPAGYAFAKFDFPGRELLFWIFLLAMMVPGSMLFLPRYMLVMDLKMGGTFPGMVLPGVLIPSLILLSRQYLRGLSDDLLEAARMDGASEAQVLRYIILPMALPLVVLVAFSGFSAAWADFMWQYLVGKGQLKTLVVVVGNFLTSKDAAADMGGTTLYQEAGGATRAGLEAAVSWLIAAPSLILFGVAQKWFVKGVKI